MDILLLQFDCIVFSVIQKANIIVVGACGVELIFAV